MRSLSIYFLRLARCSSGSALIEATIAMPIAISLMCGGVDFGLALNAQATGTKSVRDAARYLARVPASAVCTWGLTNAQNLAIYGKMNPVSGVDLPLVTGWAASGGSKNYVKLGPATVCNNPTIIQMQAEFPYTSIMLPAILPNSAVLTLSAEHEERYIGN